MKKIFLLTCIVMLTFKSQFFAQKPQITDDLKDFYNFYMHNDTAKAKKYLTSDAYFQVIDMDKFKDGVRFGTMNFDRYYTYLKAELKNLKNEEVKVVTNMVDGNHGMVWTNYVKFMNDGTKRCGNRVSHSLLSNSGWKIIYVFESVQRTCENQGMNFTLPMPH